MCSDGCSETLVSPTASGTSQHTVRAAASSLGLPHGPTGWRLCTGARTSPPTPTLCSGVRDLLLLLLQCSPVSVYASHSNGYLDPWSGGGVQHSVSSSLVAVVIHSGAHHLDLRAATSSDPPDLVEARLKEKLHIAQWIKNYTLT